VIEDAGGTISFSVPIRSGLGTSTPFPTCPA
jgi:hypothetical protein